MSEAELFPDPIAEPAPRQRVPRWIWVAIVPVAACAVLFVVGVALQTRELFSLSELDAGWEAFPEPTAADRAAVMNAGDVARWAGLEGADTLGELEKTHYQNGTFGLDYAFQDGPVLAESEPYVFSSIDDEATVDLAERTFRLLDHDGDPDYVSREDLFRWGDASRCYVHAPDGGAPEGYAFVGRRGVRVVWAEWGGAAYRELSAEELAAFLEPIAERMASHEMSDE